MEEANMETAEVPGEEVFENYGVFESDYEFKFVQEGSDKTTLMLPNVTYNSMDVQYFNIEIEVDNLLQVENIKVNNTEQNTVKYCLRIAKQRLLHVDAASESVILQSPDIKPSIDVHNYSKSKSAATNTPTGADSGPQPVQMIVRTEGQMMVKAKEEALDGTELCTEINDESAAYSDGDDDDDLGDAVDESTMTEASQQSTSDPDRKRRKYVKRNQYSRKVSEELFVTVKDVSGSGEKFFQCKNCAYSSKWMGNMRDHVRIHTGQRPFVCEICKKDFTNQSSYNSHVILHSDARPHVCKTCGYTFKVKRQLVKHEMRHNTTGQFECKYCERKYYTNTELKNHLPVHTKERKHECTICNKKFTSVSSLSRHKLTHSGGSYQCHLCANTFMRKEYWRRHMLKGHGFSEDDPLLTKRVRYPNLEGGSEGTPTRAGQPETGAAQIGHVSEEFIKMDPSGAIKPENMGTRVEVQQGEEGEVQYIISLAY